MINIKNIKNKLCVVRESGREKKRERKTKS